MTPFCSICISDLDIHNKYYLISTEDCKHCFCLGCSGEWFYRQQKCPYCNTMVKRLLKVKNKNNSSKVVLIIDLQNIKLYSKEKFVYLIKEKTFKKKKGKVVLNSIIILSDSLGIL